MKTLIVYDSQYGNTENIARTIGGAMNDGVKIVRIGDAAATDVNGIELLIIGSPTQGGRATKSISAFVDNLTETTLKNIKVAVFDTRLTTKLVTLFGYATGKITSSLKSKHVTLIVPAEGFLVKGAKGPLVDGEEGRAAAWGKKIVEAAK
jgi:flavodoxin I